MLLNDEEQPTMASGRQGPSPGIRVFEHDGIVVYPTAVLFDLVRDRLIVVVPTVAKNPSSPTTIDVLLARIGAFVIAGVLKFPLSRTPIELYLRYPGDIDVAIDANLLETAQQVERRREYLRCHGHTVNHHEQQIIPAQVLAYVLATTNKHAYEACRRTNLGPASSQKNSILTDKIGSRRSNR